MFRIPEIIDRNPIPIEDHSETMIMINMKYLLVSRNWIGWSIQPSCSRIAFIQPLWSPEKTVRQITPMNTWPSMDGT